LHETGKYLLEFLRASGLTPPSGIVQRFSLCAAIAAAVALMVLSRRRSERESPFRPGRLGA
jgi:hypothetical protein